MNNFFKNMIDAEVKAKVEKELKENRKVICIVLAEQTAFVFLMRQSRLPLNI